MRESTGSGPSRHREEIPVPGHRGGNTRPGEKHRPWGTGTKGKRLHRGTSATRQPARG